MSNSPDAAREPGPSPILSPDGHWMWDGVQWVPAAGGGRGPLGQSRSIGTSILLAIVTLGIYTLVWTYKTHDEIKRHSGAGVGGVLGFVIYFVVSPVTWFIVPSETRQMYAAAGRESPVKGTTGLWILLPIIGAFVWFAKVQGALNDYWRTAG